MKLRRRPKSRLPAPKKGQRFSEGGTPVNKTTMQPAWENNGEKKDSEEE